MNIDTYIKNNWNDLPKSTFNTDEVVIFKCDDTYDGGWGHHDYAGWGVNENGEVCYCYSSGCSCNGSCNVDIEDSTFKVLVAEKKFDDIKWQDVEFNGLQVEYYDY